MEPSPIRSGQLRVDNTGRVYMVVNETEKDGVWWVLSQGELERWWYDGIDCDEVVE